MPSSRLNRVLAAAAALAVIGVTAGCSSSAPAGGPTDNETTLTVYTDQHAELIETLTAAYTEETGVRFNIQQDATVGQIEAEGAASPADVFLSEDPAPVARLGKAGLLSTIDDSILEHVRPWLNSSDGQWVAYAARTRVLYYNPTLIAETELPKTLADIVDAKYQGMFAYAPSGAFVATTQYLLSTIGEAQTTEFLTALKENGVNEHKNGNVRDTVEAGKHAMGLSNHYYWWIKAAEVGGPENMTSKIYHFPESDPGNLVLSSGAAILKSSKQQKAAADFVAWLTAADGGQEIFASGDIDRSGAQYPAAIGVSSSVVGSLDDLEAPRYDMDIFADQTEAADLLKKLGMSD